MQEASKGIDQLVNEFDVCSHAIARVLPYPAWFRDGAAASKDFDHNYKTPSGIPYMHRNRGIHARLYTHTYIYM